MTDQQDPIIAPPLELMRQMREQAPRYRDGGVGREEWLIERASGWGYEQRGADIQKARDEELDACCEWLDAGNWKHISRMLRAARRPKPKPPSLKEQALKELAWVDKNLNMPLLSQCDAIHTIRRAIEALPD